MVVAWFPGACTPSVPGSIRLARCRSRCAPIAGTQRRSLCYLLGDAEDALALETDHLGRFAVEIVALSSYQHSRWAPARSATTMSSGSSSRRWKKPRRRDALVDVSLDKATGISHSAVSRICVRSDSNLISSGLQALTRPAAWSIRLRRSGTRIGSDDIVRAEGGAGLGSAVVAAKVMWAPFLGASGEVENHEETRSSIDRQPTHRRQATSNASGSDLHWTARTVVQIRRLVDVDRVSELGRCGLGRWLRNRKDRIRIDANRWHNGIAVDDVYWSLRKADKVGQRVRDSGRRDQQPG